MATVRKGLEPVAVFPAPKGKKQGKRMSVYPAEHWEKWGGAPGRWRVMIGERWHTRKGERVSFFTAEGMRALVGEWGLRALGIKADKADIVSKAAPRGTLVWLLDSLPAGDVDSDGVEVTRVEPAHFATRTRTVPFADEYGEWRVWVGFRSKPVLLADLRPRADGQGFDLVERGA